MAVLRTAFVILAVLVAGCGGKAYRPPSWPDAPVQLRDDSDRDAAIDQLWVMTHGPERDRARAEIAAATARRIGEAIEEDRPFIAARLLDQLTWMWQGDAGNIGRGLASHASLLRQLRGLFAKSGALEPAIQTLVVLAEVEPERRAAHLAEIDEILEFADELARAEHGEHAGRAQPLALLQPTATALPLPWLVDRYVALLVERQLVVSNLIDQQGASMQLVRAHQDILHTARRIAIVLARAGRTSEIFRHVSRVKGIGSDRELTIRAEVVVDQPTPDAYAELASQLRGDDTTPDAAAALAVGVAGLARFPGDSGLLAGAGGDARTLGRIDQAIDLYERALRGSAEVDTAVALRLGKLYAERIGRLASNGRPRAANNAWRGVMQFTAKAARQHPHLVWQQTAAIAESALGKGLASQGLIGDGRRALTASLERAPSIDAFETLATIELQVDRFRDAERWAASGMSLLGGESRGDRYRRAKLERIVADALRRAGKPRLAAARYLDSLRTWASLGETKELPRAIAAERFLDMGRAMWWLGDAPKAVDLVMNATDHDPDSPAVAAGSVAFLIEAGRYRDAVDACHRGLGQPSVGQLYQVYMSLWIIAEGQRLGEPRDRLASDYLASRRGDLWYELLAQAASGKVSYDVLRAAATTGPRRGELAFYGAVLGLDPRAATASGRKKLLEEAIEAHVVFDAEYDLARRYLASP
jgi:tetratricopeptide (TPR) repeat protein